MDDDGGGDFPNQKVRKIYNAKYQKTYSNLYYVLENVYIKDTIIRRTYSGRKRRETVSVYLKGLLYRDAEGSPQL